MKKLQYRNGNDEDILKVIKKQWQHDRLWTPTRTDEFTQHFYI